MYKIILLLVVATLCAGQDDYAKATDVHPLYSVRRQGYYSKDYSTSSGTGLYGSLSDPTGSGPYTGTFGGRVSLFDTDNHRASGWLQHQQSFDPSFGKVGSGLSGGGIDYHNYNTGGQLGISGYQYSDIPAQRFELGGSIPLNDNGNIRLGASASRTFIEGREPTDTIGCRFDSQLVDL